MRIGVVAPGGRSTPEVAARVQALVASAYPQAELVFHPQCFLTDGHFAGPDQARADAFVEVANDPSFDALWFARGGYGAGRLTELVLPRLTDAARAKTYLGYSDAGSLLGALYGRGFRNIVHGSMPQDIVRAGGEAAVARSLAWLAERAPSSLEGGIAPGEKTAAFNIVILSHLLGTPWQPDLSGHVLLLEEVSEYMYRIDRSLLQITSNPDIRKVAGIRLGRCSDIPANDPDFGRTEEEVARYWCERAGIPYLGRADIGHDVDNKVVPFGGV
ncbi:LD-carboxypeptidase [Caulobacter sp. 17J65-9]|uniref:LD-carboxypeptidase n=1 Tax=Caulobacter sp. 17J65-9 TaxID=2709382 RepID=UPI0013C81929|nr:LD-carboxypeptidase [Caulobacter sp. 17J65-9]